MHQSKHFPNPQHAIIKFYIKTLLFGLILYALFYGYSSLLGSSEPANKAAGDTAIVLIGFSMLLSSFCYFWDRFDRYITYRKYLGLIGFAFFAVHLFFSWGAFTSLFDPTAWGYGFLWAPLTGTIAGIIFTIMFTISNQYSIKKLGGKRWRQILRLGYLAIFFVWLHVIFIKKNIWLHWYHQGPDSLPSSSLLITVFIFFVLYMRIVLEIDLRRNKPTPNPKS